MPLEPHDRLIDLAEHQHGLVARHQAPELGVTRRQWYRLTQCAEWEPVSGTVLRRRGAPCSPYQRALIACLDCGNGAALYGRSAAAVWGIPGFWLTDPPEVVRSRAATHRPSELAVVHTAVRFGPEHVRIMDDMPVTAPAQTIFDLARTEHPRRVERALDAAWSKRLLCGRDLHEVLDEIAMSGRNGVTLMRELLEERGRDYTPPASNLERRFVDVLEEEGEPPMRRQVDAGGGRWVGRVDFADDDLPLIAEINSERYHAALVDRRADEARYAALRAAGFVVLVFWDREVWSDGRRVARAVAGARRRLRVAMAA